MSEVKDTRKWCRIKPSARVFSISNTRFTIDKGMVLPVPKGVRLDEGLFDIYDNKKEAEKNAYKGRRVVSTTNLLDEVRRQKEIAKGKPSHEERAKEAVPIDQVKEKKQNDKADGSAQKLIDNYLAQNATTVLKALGDDNPDVPTLTLLLEEEKKDKKRAKVIGKIIDMLKRG